MLTFLLAEKSVRGVILDGTVLIQEMQTRHGLDILEALILGQALLATTLMASSLKGHDEIGLRIDCSGPIKGLVAEATATGEVRGYLKQVPIPLASPLQSLDDTNTLNPLWGEGLLTINRYLEGGKQPFSGSVVLQSGNIGSEIANYYSISEQIPTTIHLSLFFDSSGKLNGAGGLFLQAMPGVNNELFASLALKTQSLPSLGQALANGQKIRTWITEQFFPLPLGLLEDRPVHFHCRCDDKRMRLLLLHLPLADLEEMCANGPFPVQINCHFCNAQYLFEQTALAELCQEKRSFT